MRHLNLVVSIAIGAVVGVASAVCAHLLGSPDWEAALFGVVAWPVMTTGMHVVVDVVNEPPERPAEIDRFLGLCASDTEPATWSGLRPLGPDPVDATVVYDRAKLGSFDRQQPGSHRAGVR